MIKVSLQYSRANWKDRKGVESVWRGNPSQRLEAGLQRQAHSSIDVERSCPTLRIKYLPQTIGRIFKKM